MDSVDSIGRYVDQVNGTTPLVWASFLHSLDLLQGLEV